MVKVKCEHTRMEDPKKLLPHPKNPNRHPGSQLRMLTKSIERFGWRHPIIVSKRSGYIVAGHARRMVAIELKCDVPIDEQEFETEADEIAMLLADNILPELAELEHELLQWGKEFLIEHDIELEYIGVEDIETPDFMPVDEDEQPRLDEKKKIVCPECGHEFEA